MNKFLYKPIVAVIMLSAISIFSCSKSFLERDPLGDISEATLSNKTGIEGLLIGAYSLLDGWGASGTGNPWTSPVSNFIIFLFMLFIFSSKILYLSLSLRLY